MNRIACVTVWFNPSNDSYLNISQYLNLFDKIYIIDNSETTNSFYINDCSKIEYLPNNKNLGIARALNIGCEKALLENFKWVVTMDQDSSWITEQLEAFIEKSEILYNNDSKIVSFGPQHSNEIKSSVGQLCYNKKHRCRNEFVFKNKIMTSGNLINLNAWNEVGKFNDNLFIDEVDHEFCYRLNDSGYKICEFQNIFMIHTLGNVKKTFLPRPCKHSGVRLFYIFRNMLYIKDNFPYYFKVEKYSKYMFYAVIQKLLEFKFKDLKYIRQGKKAFKNNNFGVYNY